MRFMVMHKVDPKMEAGGPPDQQIVQAMGALVQEGLKDGVFITGAGLHRSAKRVRVKSSAGHTELEPGPYAGDNELLASYAMIKTRSVEDALPHARRFATKMGDREVELGPVVEPWDLGLMPKPSGEVPLQVLLLVKADAAFERGQSSASNDRAALDELAQSLGNDGALIASGTLAPSSKGARLTRLGLGKRTWVDGPFAESKELIAGFSVIERPSLAAAKLWADRYAAILSEAEVDVRLFADS